MRRPFLFAYLLFLAASTAVRWRTGAFEHPKLTPERWSGTNRPPVVVLLDDEIRPTGPRLVEALGLMTRPVVITRGELDRAATGGIGHFHLLAFGAAGPDAIAFAAAHRESVRSLVLIDADGVEEFDLLGDHRLNRVLRHAQVVAIEAAKALLPHFGVLDVIAWRPEARTQRLLGADRRGLRDALARWDGPAAIYVRDSSRNAIATAREHARLLPQSSLGPWEGDSLTAFLDRVDAGTATTRATADPTRIAAAARPFDAGGIPSAEGSALFVVLLLLALTNLLSEDLACVTAGVLAARGSIPLVPAIVACYLGIVLGDQLLYLLGRTAGRALVTRIPIRWILPPERLDLACEWFRTNGMKVVLTSRLLPGTRFPVYVAAGILRGGFVRFALWLMAIGAVWTPLAVGGSYLAARRGRSLVEALPGATWAWALGAILLLLVVLRVVPPLIGRVAKGWTADPPAPPAGR